MSELAFEKIVIVASMHGEKFFGTLPDHVEDPDKYFSEAINQNKPVIIENVRIMLSQCGAVTRADGSMGGIQTTVALIPIDLADGPMEKIHVRPSSWYFPSEVLNIRESVTRLLKQAEDGELRNRAIRSGLSVAGDMPSVSSLVK